MAEGNDDSTSLRKQVASLQEQLSTVTEELALTKTKVSNLQAELGKKNGELQTLVQAMQAMTAIVRQNASLSTQIFSDVDRKSSPQLSTHGPTGSALQSPGTAASAPVMWASVRNSSSSPPTSPTTLSRELKKSAVTLAHATGCNGPLKARIVRAFVGHTEPVHAICAIERESRIISGSSDNAIMVFDKSTGSGAPLLGHEKAVLCLVRMNDATVVSGSADRTVRIWNLSTSVCTKILSGHMDAVKALCIMAAGMLASASADRTVRFWNLSTGDNVSVLQGHTASVNCLCLLDNGSLVSGSSDCSVRLWNPISGGALGVLEGHSGPVHAVCQAGDDLLASGSADCTVRVWSCARKTCLRTLNGHSAAVVSLVRAQLSADIDANTWKLFSGGLDRQLVAWDAASGKNVGAAVFGLPSVGAAGGGTDAEKEREILSLNAGKDKGPGVVALASLSSGRLLVAFGKTVTIVD